MKEEFSRPPELADLVDLCRKLNLEGARYIVIGGMAMLRAGFVRATEDIDLLIASDRENEEKVLLVLGGLPDGAAKEIDPGEISRFEIIRVADEIVIDLMTKAGGVRFEEAEEGIRFDEIEGVRIPFASAKLLLRLKQSLREKDVLDRRFLEQILGKQEDSENS